MNHKPSPIRSFFAILTWLALCSPTIVAADDAAETTATATASRRIRQNFDAGWSFSKTDTHNASESGFDHSAWRKLDLPHDWSIEGPFDQKAASGAAGG